MAVGLVIVVLIAIFCFIRQRNEGASTSRAQRHGFKPFPSRGNGDYDDGGDGSSGGGGVRGVRSSDYHNEGALEKSFLRHGSSKKNYVTFADNETSIDEQPSQAPYDASSLRTTDTWGMTYGGATARNSRNPAKATGTYKSAASSFGGRSRLTPVPEGSEYRKSEVTYYENEGDNDDGGSYDQGQGLDDAIEHQPLQSTGGDNFSSRKSQWSNNSWATTVDNDNARLYHTMSYASGRPPQDSRQSGLSVQEHQNRQQGPMTYPPR
ncbi:hypothetical protein BGZ65_011061, partial [Modicella reniformis]